MLSKKQKSKMQRGGGLPASMPTLSDMNIGLAIPGVFPTAPPAAGGYRKKSHKSKKNKKSKSRSKSNRRSRKNRK